MEPFTVQPLPPLLGAPCQQDMGTSPEGGQVALVPNGPNSLGHQGAAALAAPVGAGAGPAIATTTMERK